MVRDGYRCACGRTADEWRPIRDEPKDSVACTCGGKMERVYTPPHVSIQTDEMAEFPKPNLPIRNVNTGREYAE